MTDMKRITVILILALFFCTSVFGYNLLIEEEADFDSSCQSDFDGDGITDKVELIKLEPANLFQCTRGKAVIKLISKGRIFTKKLEPISVENCGVGVLVIDDKTTPFIVFYSHSQWLIDIWEVTLYSFNGKRIVGEARINSDKHSIEVKDVDGNGVKDIVALCRYDANSIESDTLIQTYKYIDDRWRLKSIYRPKTKENIPVNSWIR